MAKNMKLKEEEFQKIRFQKGLSIAQIAKQAKIDEDTIYTNLANSNRTIRWSTVWKLCSVLECEPRQIISIDDK